MAKTENGKKENSEEAKRPPAEEKPAKEEKSTEGEKSEKQEIERLKFSVEKLSEELNTAVAELKRSIIDYGPDFSYPNIYISSSPVFLMDLGEV